MAAVVATHLLVLLLQRGLLVGEACDLLLLRRQALFQLQQRRALRLLQLRQPRLAALQCRRPLLLSLAQLRLLLRQLALQRAGPHGGLVPGPSRLLQRLLRRRQLGGVLLRGRVCRGGGSGGGLASSLLRLAQLQPRRLGDFLLGLHLAA